MSKLIVALDFQTQNSALSIVDLLNPEQCALKVGSEMFTLFGASWVKLLIARGFKVFLDLKFHDIPTTVARACSACADLGVWMINVHALGGEKMLHAAHDALTKFGSQRPKLVAVTVLTSLIEQDLVAVGINNALNLEVKQLATLAFNAG